MKPTKAKEGLCTTPEKRSILPSSTMGNPEQSEPKALPPATVPSATSLEDVTGSKRQASPKAESFETIVPCSAAQSLTTGRDTEASTKSLEKLGDLQIQAAPKSGASKPFPGVVTQDTTTSPLSQKEPTSSGEISLCKNDSPLPKFPYEATGTAIFSGTRPQAVIPQVESPQEAGLCSKDLEHHGDVKLPTSLILSSSKSLYVTNIRPPAAVTQPKLKQETGLPSTSLELDGDVKLPTFLMTSTSKALPDTMLPVAATQTESKAETSLPRTGFEYDGVAKVPASPLLSGFQFLPSTTLPVPANQIMFKEKPSLFGTRLEQKGPRSSDFLKGNQHEGGPNIEISAEIMTSNIVTGVNRQSATAFDTSDFQFTIDTPIPKQPGHSAAELFQFTQEAKKPLQEIKFRPLKRPVLKPHVFTQTKDPAEAPMVQVVQTKVASPTKIIPTRIPSLTSKDKEAENEPKFLSVKSSLTEAFAFIPQARKPVEEPVLDPHKTYLVEASTPTHQAQKPVEEPRLIPVKSASAISFFPTRQASQSIDSPLSPAVEPLEETKLKRSTTKDKGRQEEKPDAEKKAQAMRELLAEKREIRSQRDALAREKAALESKLQGQTNDMKKMSCREEESQIKLSAKTQEVDDLQIENGRLKNAMETVILNSAPKLEQGKEAHPVQTEISDKSNGNEDLLAERAKEIENLKDEIKKWTEKERNLKTLTGKEAQGLKANLRKAEDEIRQKKKDEEYYRKQADKDVKKIENLSEELTKLQIAKAKVDKELKILTVKSNKVETSEGELKSEASLDEVEKLRQSLEERGAEAKSAKKQAEKLERDLEASEGGIKLAKAQVGRLAKELEESNGGTLAATALASLRLKQVETLEASRAAQNLLKETSEKDKRKFRNLTADHEELRKELDQIKAANGQIESLTEHNKALSKTCQDLEKKAAEQIDKFRKLSASNSELSQKLQKSREVEARALQNLKDFKDIYKDVSPFSQVKEREYLEARLAKETEARQMSASRANLLQKQIEMQMNSLRKVRWEKSQLETIVDSQAAELAKHKRQNEGRQAKADQELVSAMLETERAKIEEADTRREYKVQTALESAERTVRETRQRLYDELELKDEELYKAQREIRELGRQLLANNEARAAALAASSSSNPSQSPPPHQTSTPPTCSTPPAAGARSWFQVQRSRTGIPMNLSAGRLLICFFIFLLAFLVPYFSNKSLNREIVGEDRWRAAKGVSPHEVVKRRSRYHRIRREARALAIWEQTDAEEGRRWPLEVGRSEDWRS